jgi:hypothetical protein
VHPQGQSRRTASALQPDSPDHGEGAAQRVRYCPAGLLDDFALLMAGHGRCVSTSMMLGDRRYAMEQLARARAMQDLQLQVLAARLSAYFEDSRSTAAA